LDNVKVTEYKVPKSIFVIIVVLLGSMYYYGAFIEPANPEKAVENFYQAYFDQNFNEVAANLSVLWSVQFLPEYNGLSPAELVAKRPDIETKIAEFIAQIELNNQMPANTSIKVIPEYTKKGDQSALVVYELVENGNPTHKEVAFLIFEKQRFRVWNIALVDDQDLELIKNYNINELDKRVKELF